LSHLLIRGMKLFIRTISIFLLATSALHGQSLKAFLNAGAEAMEDSDYYNACYYFQSALEFDTTNVDVHYLYAQASFKLKAYTRAESSFQYILDHDADQLHPLASFYLGLTQQNLGKYDLARTHFQLYLSESEGDDPYYTARAEKEIAAVEWAQDRILNPREGLNVERLNDSINTAYSEFAAVKNGSSLFYSSLRFEKEEKSQLVNRLFSKILRYEEAGTNEPLDEEFHQGGQHFANMAFSHDASSVYYTICEYSQGVELRCDIYKRVIDESGKWGAAQKLPSAINDSLSTNTQPSIAYDLRLDKEVLYFVSDREGGKGKLDIWYSIINSNGYSDPINLESVNTIENEISPFYHSPTSTLYFSTDGRLGMGGYDVYSSVKVNGTFEDPVNEEALINSSFDDVYYVLNSEGTEAYFSSNRIGSLYLDDSYEACCFDIYRAEIEDKPVELKILSYNELTRNPLNGTRVIIIDPLTDEVVFESLSPTENEHNFTVRYRREYTIITEKEGFQTDETSIKINQLEPIDKKIYLTPLAVKLDVYAYDDITRDPLPGVLVTVNNLDRDALPKLEFNESGNDFSFDINAGYNYEIIADKTGYERVIEPVNNLLIINGIIRQDVFLRPIELNEYLPVCVYFDNDRPDRRSNKLYTDKSYSETYDEYVSKKDEFKEQLSFTLSEKLAIEAEDEVERFFDKNVKQGYEMLLLFIGKLKQRLEAGDKIEISLKGYASPRAQNKYNLAIGQRRIWTIKNEIRQFENSVLEQYIDSGMLQVVEVSFGEETAPDNVSDSYQDRRSSIYSVDASRERKAEIVRVRVLNKND